MSNKELVLPQILKLNIKNMTTFPQELNMSFKKGINIIFGGNYSGKTTIINSMRFGIFGLSWGHTLEGVEMRYFSSRIREIQRKSLDINTLYRIDPITVNVRRTIFSSGTPKIDVKLSKSLQKEFSTMINTIKLEKQYHQTLRNYMGQITEEQLKIIPTLIFAGEDRKNILWRNDLKDFVLTLLISKASADQLKNIRSQRINTEKELKTHQQNGERITRIIDKKKGILEFLQISLKETQGTKVDKIIESYKNFTAKLEELRKKILQTNAEIQDKMKGKTDLLFKRDSVKEEIRKFESEKEELQTRRLTALLNPKDPEETHVLRNIWYEKQCPYCLSDLSNEVSNRQNANLCVVCGKGSSIKFNEDLKKIELELSEFDKNIEKYATSINEIQGNLNKGDEELQEINKSLEDLTKQEQVFRKKIDEMKHIEAQLHKKEVVSSELEEVKREIQHHEKLLSKNIETIQKIKSEIGELNRIYDEAKLEMQSEINKSINEVKNNFSTFVSLATNNEASVSLSTDFIPALNGRNIFHPEHASQFEQAMMDYAFRFALLSVFANKTKSTPTLVIETPDEVTDDAYIPHLARAMVHFSSNLSVVITTFSLGMTEELLTKYQVGDKRKRLLNLISKGTETQRRVYQTSLTDLFE